MYDLRVILSTGSYVDASQLLSAAKSIPHARELQAAEPRLITPTQVDASRGGRTILVPGRLIGMDFTDGPQVNGVHVERGRPLHTDDVGKKRAIIDYHFAERYELPVSHRIEVSGGHTLTTVAQGLAPEYFLVTGEQGNLLAESNFAAVFLPIEDVQSISGRVGQANDLVVTLKSGAERDVIRSELADALRARIPNVGFEIQGPRGDDAYRILYDDIESDQRFYSIFAVLILAGAAFAAFNLTGRIVESQRREIGIGMAMGVPPRQLALRPMLVGMQIAGLGALFGIGVGLAVGALMGAVLESLFPLPVWRFPFQLGVFARGAALGLAIPVVATLFPVWRAVRVSPIEAIRTGYLSAQRRVPWLARIPLPGRTTAELPLRNLLRAPRRTTMTVLGVAAAIAVLIGVVGMADSFVETIDRADEEITKSASRRTSVDLQSFQPIESSIVRNVTSSPLVDAAETHVRLGATVSRGATRFEVFLQVLPLHGGLWSPSLQHEVEDGSLAGLVLTEKAADDLGIGAGDTVTLRHPRRTGMTSYRYVRSTVQVTGLSPLPTRSMAFMDPSDLSIMGLEGLTNTLTVNPTRDTSIAELERSLFGQEGVASVQPVRDYTGTIRKEIDRYLGILTVVELAVLLLALLIGFNAASINSDERKRDHATMFAFGLPTRTVLRMAVVESGVVGFLGTVLGVLLGWLLLGWIVNVLLPETFPDLGIVTYVAPTTLAIALVLGVLMVALAPALTLRKLRRMDVPSTLRVME
jgi:putative ABC transport system permease protein